MPRATLKVVPDSKVFSNAFIYYAGTAGEVKKFNFLDGSMSYISTPIKQEFKYISIDVTGAGAVRFCLNREDLDMTNPVTGAKTLRASDIVYFEERIWQLNVYFIEDSSIELTLKIENLNFK